MNELTFDKNEIIVSKTDTTGKIIYGNKLFIKMSGFQESELLGAPHNIIRHPDMPSVVFKLLWDTLKSGKEVFAYVINKAKNGDHYWVFANVLPIHNAQGIIVAYSSVRRSPSQEALKSIKPLYQKLKAEEKRTGIQGSQQLFNEFVSSTGGNYEKFILSL